MSSKGTNRAPEPDPNLGNVDSGDLASNEQAVVVPWGCGEFKVALKWLSPVYNQFTREASADQHKSVFFLSPLMAPWGNADIDVDKGKGASGTKAHDYYGTIAG